MKTRLFLICILNLILLSSNDYVEYSFNPNVLNSNKRINLPGSYESLEYFNFQRSYPFNDIPSDGFYKGFEHSRLRLAKESVLDADDTWINIGPYNKGGRTISLAVDPNNSNILWAGSASGGLWKLTISNDDDYTWEFIDTGFPVLGVGAIVIDPRDSNTLYIGTGEVYSYKTTDGGKVDRLTRGTYGIGILKSTDGGLTWSKSLDWSYDQNSGVQAMAINPINPDVIFAATTEGTYKTSDKGITWTLVNSKLMAVDVDIDPVNDNLVYVSYGNFVGQNPGIESGFIKSSDGGQTWTNKSFTSDNTTFTGGWTGKALVDISKSDPNVIYIDIKDDLSQSGDIPGLYKSVDYGESFIRISNTDVALYQGWFAHFVRVNPADTNKIFLAGVNHAFSVNGGKLFTKKTSNNMGSKTTLHADKHAFANDPTDPNTFFVAHDGGIHRTTDNGLSWLDFSDGYITTQFYGGFSSSYSDSNLAIGGLQDNSTTMYTGDKNWVINLIGGDGSFTAINQENNNIMFGSAQRLYVARSMDRGLTWQTIPKPFPSTNQVFVAPFIMVKPGLIYAGADRIYKSTDNLETWKSINMSAYYGTGITAIGSDAANPEYIYVALAPSTPISSTNKPMKIIRLTDESEYWKSITDGLPDRYVADLMVSPHDFKEVYVVLSGFGTSHLYRTQDAGDTWIDIGQGLPDVPSHAVIVDPIYGDNIYFGNDLGVYVSLDKGDTWSEFQVGMPTAAIVMDLSISNSNRKLRAVTHGNGVFERSLLNQGIITNIEDDEPNIPVNFELKQNYPNPFNPETNIQFSITKNEKVTITIYNTLGQQVRKLVNKEFPPGSHIIKWNGRDNFGNKVSSGTYIYRITAGKHESSKKMILIK